MPEAKDQSFAEVLARNVAARRTAHIDPYTGKPFSQARLAREVQEAGLDWTQATVAGVETARRAVTAQELLVLSRVLRTPIPGLLEPGDAVVVVVGAEAWTADFVRQVARGEVEDLDDSSAELEGQPSLAEDMKRTSLLIGAKAPLGRPARDDFLAKWGLDWGDMTVRTYKEIVGARGGAESEAASRVGRLAWRAGLRRLQLGPPDVAAVAYRLWTSTYEAERERRVGEQMAADAPDRTRQALRGHVVRQLDQEIFDAMQPVLSSVSAAPKKRTNKKGRAEQ